MASPSHRLRESVNGGRLSRGTHWRESVRRTLISLLVSVPALAAEVSPPVSGFDPAATRARIAAVQPRMSWLENEQIKVGVDLNLGGAITYLARRDGPNLINRHDWGRQIQMSFYSGAAPARPGGPVPSPLWARLGWNPIQAGDYGGFPSRVIEEHNDGTTLTVKCIPMLWPYANQPAHCTCQWTLTLDGPAVGVHAQFDNHRADPTEYPAKNQELPAAYGNGPWYHLYAYTGDRPFAGQPAGLIPNRRLDERTFPWTAFTATENWAALVNDRGEGFGVWAPGVYTFLGGFVGPEGVGGPRDRSTGYIAPVRREILDHNIVYEYGFAVIAGSLTEIRNWVYAHAGPPAPFGSVFARDRAHWYPDETLADGGWPVTGHLALRFTQDGRGRLVSPQGFWPTAQLPAVFLRAAHHTVARQAELSFQLFAAPGAPAVTGHVNFPIVSDGRYHTYKIPLAGAPRYAGIVTQFRLQPAVGARAGDTVEIEYITQTRR